MTTDKTDADAEVAAIGAGLKALEPLDPASRSAVFDYVVRRLKIATVPPEQHGAGARAPPTPQIGGQSVPPPLSQQEAAGAAKAPAHFGDFLKSKKPRSDSEAATLVAFWIREYATEKRDWITRKDIEQFFKIGDHPLPEKPEYTLPNAKNGGYLEAIGDGKYRLNPVGHNLVVHTLPRSGDSAERPRAVRTRTARARPKPSERGPSKRKGRR